MSPLTNPGRFRFLRRTFLQLPSAVISGRFDARTVSRKHFADTPMRWRAEVSRLMVPVAAGATARFSC